MLQQTLIELYSRDLEKLKTEIEQYPDESDMWTAIDGTPNSGGNLCLHLTGNLQHFFGAVLGGSGYVRNRDAEFADKNVSRADMIAEVDKALASVTATLAKLSDADLAATYPIEVFGHPMTTEYFVIHLATHFNYHLGQINYHRRLVS